ncbi:MAG: hypothetical protein ACFFAS_10870 [Promethearchaeota archaeon]
MEKNIKKIKKKSKKEQQYGHSIVLKASLESKNLDSYENVIKMLDDVRIPEDDYQWYNDVILFLKAEASNRFDQKDMEEEYLKQFWIKQPYLFEPDHVFSLGLEKYQQKLKEHYRKKKTMD